MSYERLRRASLAIFSAIAASLIAASLGGAEDLRGAAATKPVLTIGITSAFVSLDPAKGGGTGPPPLAFEPIMYARPDGSFTPGLAVSWHYLRAKPNSLRANKDFEFTLRRNARFSDGTPVTAQAVVNWFEYYLKTSAVATNFLAPVQSFEAVGKWTVIIHLKSPFPDIPWVTLSWRGGWGGVSSPQAVQDPTSLSQATYGAGPYMLDPSQTVSNDHYTLVPNPYYYDKSKIKWSKVVYKVIPNATSMLSALQTGQVDVAAGDASTAAAAASSGFSVFDTPATNALFTLDVKGAKVKALADVRVRQALNFAIDRRTIATAFAGKYATPTSAFATLNGSWKAYANAYPYNPAKAKSLLAAAGYPNGFTIDGVLTAGFLGNLGTPFCQAVARYLAAVGVTLNLTPTGTLADYLAQGPAKADQPAMMQWPAGVTTMATIYGLAMKPNARVNHVAGGWNDPVLNHMAVLALRAANPQAQLKLITERITKQAYFLPVLATDSFVYVNTKVVRNVPPLGVAFRYANDLSTELDWTPA